MDVTSLRRALLLALVVTLVATALLAIGFLLVGEFDDTTLRIVGTTALLSLFSVLALPAGVLLDQGRARGMAFLTGGVAIVAFFLWMSVVWADRGDPAETRWKLVAVASAFTVAMSQSAMATSRLRAEDTRAVTVAYWLSIVCVFTVALLVVVAVAQEVEEEGLYRALGAFAVADVLLVVLQPVLRRMAGVRGGPTTAATRSMTLRVTAPDNVDLDVAVDEAVATLERAGARVERR